MLNPTGRFSDRVESYVKYRPSYPAGVIAMLRKRAGLSAESVVADVGSGTGIFTELLLPCCRQVYAVEPNAEMRGAAETRLGQNANFVSVAASAEATTLPDGSVDLIAAAQAFHWFDRAACRREWTRIVKPGGWVALVWNDRLTDASPFLTEYEALLQRHATDYAKVNHANLTTRDLAEFFGASRVETVALPNEQRFNFEGLRGRLLSSSYAPNVGQPGHQPMMAELRRIYEAHAVNGEVAFLYRTTVHLGQLRAHAACPATERSDAGF